MTKVGTLNYENHNTNTNSVLIEYENTHHD